MGGGPHGAPREIDKAERGLFIANRAPSPRVPFSQLIRRSERRGVTARSTRV